MSRVWEQPPEAGVGGGGGWPGEVGGGRIQYLYSLPGPQEQQPGPEGPGRPTPQWGCGGRNSAFDEPEAVGSPAAPSLAVPSSPPTAAAVHAASPFPSGTWEGWGRAPFPWRLRTPCSHRHFLRENTPRCWKQGQQMNAGVLLWSRGCWPGPASSGLTTLRKQIPGPQMADTG